MSFDPSWLDLRESADHAARDRDLLGKAKAFASGVSNQLIVDLACGSGSTARAFDMPDVRWRLIDHDPELLRLARSRTRGAEVRELDLRDPRRLDLKGVRLVTTSAFIDLVSAHWVDAFAEHIAASSTGFYAALTYDGTMSWTPVDEVDAAVTAAFNRHQQTDKGFGSALGPRGASVLAEVLQARGYLVEIAASPWRLDAADADLQSDLLKGIASAALEAGEASADAWLERRLAAIPHSRCEIGHLDVLALPRTA